MLIWENPCFGYLSFINCEFKKLSLRSCSTFNPETRYLANDTAWNIDDTIMIKFKIIQSPRI